MKCKAAHKVQQRRTKKLQSQYKVFFSQKLTSIVTVSIELQEVRLMHAVGKFKIDSSYGACALVSEIFLIGRDSSCKMLLPDFENWEFGIEERRSLRC